MAPMVSIIDKKSKDELRTLNKIFNQKKRIKNKKIHENNFEYVGKISVEK